MDMSSRIKERRKAMNLTQEELADKLGLQKSAIAKYENGRVENIKRSVILRMATILDCKPSYLLGWDDPDDDVDNKWYLDPETAQLAQEVFEDPATRMLFDAARDARPEDIKLAAEMLKRLKETNPDG